MNVKVEHILGGQRAHIIICHVHSYQYVPYTLKLQTIDRD